MDLPRRTRTSLLALALGSLGLMAQAESVPAEVPPAPAPSAEPERTWTDLRGRTLTATLLAADAADRVTLKLSGGAVVTLALGTLSGPDQRYVRNWRADAALRDLAGQTSRFLEEAAKPPAPPPTLVSPRAYQPPASPYFTRSKAEIQETLKGILQRKDSGLVEGEQRALNRLNAFRYLCGLPHGVSIRREYQPYVDAAARLCRAIGRLDHGPPNPGWAEEEYEKGRRGAGSSNLFATSGGGGVEIAAGSVTAYLDDGATNPNLGHRRWCLNPRLGATAFSGHEGYSAMWVMDGSGPEVDWEFVAFPAPGYFPAEFFGRRYQWNVTLNPARFSGWKEVTAEQVKVYDLRRETEVPADQMKPLKLEYFNVDTGGFGVANSIGFLPEGVDLDKGSRYRVEIHGLERKGHSGPLVYLVEFF
jgi:hypothetical protein